MLLNSKCKSMTGWTGLNRGSASRSTPLPQRAQDERNGRSGRHSPRDVSPHSLGRGDTLPDAEAVIFSILPILAILSRSCCCRLFFAVSSICWLVNPVAASQHDTTPETAGTRADTRAPFANLAALMGIG